MLSRTVFKRALGHLHPFVHGFARETRGAVAVEFALIGPLLIVMLFGILTLGYYTGVSFSVQQLAAGAARASVPGLDAEERRTLANNYLDASGTRYPLLVSEAVTPTVTLSAGSTPGMTVAITYAVSGTMLDIANDLLQLGIEDIRGQAYVGY